MTRNDIKIERSTRVPLGHPSQSVLIRRTAHNLTRIMIERGMSVEELAVVLGLCPVYVRDFLAGQRNISVLTVVDICLKLDVDLGQLVLPSPPSEWN